MLEYIRNHVGGLVGLLIIGALSFVFAVSFGQQSEGWGKGAGDGIALAVEGVEITDATVNYAINMNINREISEDSPEFVSLRQQVTKGLVERQLLLNMAEKANISASTEEAQKNIINGEFFITRPISAIVSQLSFQLQYSSVKPSQIVGILVKDGHRARLGRFVDDKGKFDTKSFNNLIRYRLNYKEPAFVEEQRLEIIAQRMRTLLIGGITVSEQAVKEAYERDNDTATLSYIKLAPALYAGNLDSESVELQKWTESNNDAIKQNYEANKYKYTNVEKQVRARHILVKVEQEADDAIKTAAKQKIEAFLQRAKNGEDFASLAKENSEDPGSAAQGGDLGYNKRGVMEPAFDEAMFALEAGGLSEVVTTKFGFHVIKLENVREGTVSLEDATEEIARKLFQENHGKEVMQDVASKLLAKLNSGTNINDILTPKETEQDIVAPTDVAAAPADAVDTVNEAALELPDGINLFVQTTSAFNKNDKLIPGIGESEELINTAFALTEQKPAANKVFTINDNFFVVQLLERQKPSDEDFNEKKEAIKDKLLSSKVVTWMNDRSTSLLEKALKDNKIDSNIPIYAGNAPKEKTAAAGGAQPPAPATPKKSVN